MDSVAALLDAATARLAEAGGLDRREARLEARTLAAHAWARDTAWLIAHDRDPVDAADAASYRTLIERRAAGEPVAYLTGRREFFGHVFAVSPGVLIPRPETELLVETALAELPENAPASVLDLGAGSGCIAISIALARPAARVVAVDRSGAALAVARHNADRLGVRVDFRQGDWFEPVSGERFDLIVSNPPYIAAADPHLVRGDLRFEPRDALASGVEGLDDPGRIVRAALAHLEPGGGLWLEHGYNQADAIAALLRAEGHQGVTTLADHAGLPRVTGGRRPR